MTTHEKIYREQIAWWRAMWGHAQQATTDTAIYGVLHFEHALNDTLRAIRRERGLPLADEGFVLPHLRPGFTKTLP